MKIAIISPTKFLETYSSLGEVHMCLAHEAVRNSEYASFFNKQKAAGKWVLMDNGAHEGERVVGQALVDLCKIVNPSCVIMPDVLDDYHETRSDTLEFYEKHADDVLKLGVSLMAVPQGKTFAEFLDNYRTFAALKNVDFLGISYTILFNDIPGYEDKIKNCKTKTEQQKVRRSSLIKYLEENDILDKSKKHHLLGLADPTEFHEYMSIYGVIPTYIHSCDTTFAFTMGQANRIIDSISGVIGEREKSLEDFNSQDSLNSTQDACVRHNIYVILEFAKDLWKVKVNRVDWNMDRRTNVGSEG